VKFFFPDSQDQIDPGFDFITERSPEFRVRQRDDRYAHEVLHRPAYDGLLVSKPIVDGLARTSGKYTLAQRHRLYRKGVRGFFRLDRPEWSVATMGDCGAFTYVREEVPPYTVDEVIDFYDGCQFDYGISVDHVILGYDPTHSAPELVEWVERQRLTLELAAEFHAAASRREVSFRPIGVAQGWSPSSYAHAVSELQRIGFRYIALGGMVPLKSVQIEACLRAVADVRLPDVRLHLLGISRLDRIPDMSGYGVVSFDSTSPFRQAFKDDHDNYYADDCNYVAIRVPQVDGNAQLMAAIRAGRIDQRKARDAEQTCLRLLREFDGGHATVNQVLEALRLYAELVEPDRDRTPQYRELLERALWKECDCGICEDVGIQVAIFRGTERNKRRGFHNLHVFSMRLAAVSPKRTAAATNLEPAHVETT
jgi:hypothetical protein